MPEISKEVCNFARLLLRLPWGHLEVLSVKPEAQIGAASPRQRAFANESQKPYRACVVGMVDLHQWL